MAKEVGARLGTREVLFQEVCRGSEGGRQSTQSAVTDLLDAVVTPTHTEIESFDRALIAVKMKRKPVAHLLKREPANYFQPAYALARRYSLVAVRFLARATGFIDLGHNTTAHTITSWLNTLLLTSEW